MFDIYGVIDFCRRIDLSKIENPFPRYRYYSDVPYKDYCIQIENAKVFYLERHDHFENYYHHNGCCLFIFGFVFSNKNYESSEGTKPKKLSAHEVYELYRKYNNEIVNYIKGSFVLIIYSDIENNIFCISDQLNVLPIFYAYKDGVFIFSSAMKPILDSGFIRRVINKAAVVEFALFDYTLGSDTFYEEIKMLDYGTILNVDESGARKRRYFEISTLFQRRLMNQGDSLMALKQLLRENISLYAADSEQFLLSLTGGFDGRANLALVDRPAEDFLCYSYGMSGSQQITIPLEIARTLKINYQPVYLDKNFEGLYEDCALMALFSSDGTAPILRANYPYAYRQLGAFSDIAVTGLFGSEILRPVRNLGIQINDNSERLFKSKDFDGSLKLLFEHEKNRGYLKPELFEKCYDEIREYVWQHFFAPHQDVDKLTRFFYFYIEEGIRKYFMQEIRIERLFISTRFPYFDFDLVSFIYKTPFAGLYNGALKESPLGRRKAQLLYAQVIKEYKPILGGIATDRGYTPNDLLSPFFFFKVLPGYLKTQLHKRKISNDTFDPKRWTDFIFRKNRGLMKKETSVFPGTLISKHENNENIRDNYRFSRMFSLKYWFEEMQNTT